MKVAVIGAGAAGLVAAREVLKRGFDLTVYESSANVGGVWVYNENTEDDPLGQNPSERIHGSLYASLTTNLPRDLMAFSDYTFDSAGGGDDHWHRFPRHDQVCAYLENFAEHFSLLPHIRFQTPVEKVIKLADAWQISAGGRAARYDAVIVCNGHYSKPRIPELDGLSRFTGAVSHSHNYRTPDQFTDQRVVIWGTAASGFDIASDISRVASSVHVCGNAFETTVPLGPKIVGMPSPKGINEDGAVLVGEETIEADHFMFCTGYEFDFPFLDVPGISVDDNWVHPLYHDIVPVNEPSIGFIGLPYLVVPFPLFEVQAHWFVSSLAGEFNLPDIKTMQASVDRMAREKKSAGILQRHFHRLGENQEGYFNQLAGECGCNPMPGWFMKTWQDIIDGRMANMGDYKEIDYPRRGPTVCL